MAEWQQLSQDKTRLKNAPADICGGILLLEGKTVELSFYPATGNTSFTGA
jgi:hypothetical protein